MPKFIPGLKLSQFFFEEAIQPLLTAHFPQLPYSAARLEWGSDVIGFDTAMSMDHGWGPKMTLFLTEEDYLASRECLWDFFANHLPFTIHGFPTHFGEPLSDGGRMSLKEDYPIHHMITITTPQKFFMNYLGVDITQSLFPKIWLSLPQQHLCTLRAGQIYFDGLGTLVEVRGRFEWYPHDLWLYLLASQWQRIDQEAPFMGRTSSLGDEIGSRLIAARLVRDSMRLAFLLERVYAPYSKWLGTAFNQLNTANEMTPLLQSILDSQDWKGRETLLIQVFTLLGEAQNALSITPFIHPESDYFHQRPFLVPPASQFVNALRSQIKDPMVSALPPHIGGVDQISDNTDILDNLEHCMRLRHLFAEPGP